MAAISHENMRAENINTVFNCIRQNQHITKRDIMEYTKLSWFPVSGIISQLLESELIVEKDSEGIHEVGRPPKEYDINGRDNFIIGIDINIRAYYIAVIHFKGRTVYNQKIPMLNTDKDYIINYIKSIIHQILCHEQFSGKHFRGLAFSVMGSVNSRTGVSYHIPLLPDWNMVNLKGIYEKEFNLPVLVEHDPGCMALHQMYLDNRTYDNMIFLRISYGVGMSIIINNEIYSGFTCNSGELGLLNYGNPAESDKLYKIDDYLSFRGIVARYMADNPNSRFGDNLNADTVFAAVKALAYAARSGDKTALGYFKENGRWLGLACSNLFHLFNPEKNIIGDILTDYSDLFLDETINVIEKYTVQRFRPQIEISLCGEESAAVGAALLFIKNEIWNTIIAS
jgi:predicted NBD/HSP70 family sugar kinase